ncbi:hypothetical protein [Anaerotignum sp.]
MTKIGNAFIALGIVLLFSAAGNDDMYTAMHMAMPLKDLFLYAVSGFACIGIGGLLKTIKVKG